MERPLWATPDRIARLNQIAIVGCAKGEPDCPALKRFAEGIRARIGPPTEDPRLLWAWLARASLISPIVLAEMSPLELFHLPFWVCGYLKALWKGQDRQEREQAWRREKRRLHAGPKILKRGPFGTIDREEYLAQRPIWQIEAVGIGAFTFKRVAKVRIPALEKVIWVGLPPLKGVGKNAKRKYLRYGRGQIPKEIETVMVELVSRAVHKALA